MNTDDVFFLNTDWHGLNGMGVATLSQNSVFVDLMIENFGNFIILRRDI